MRGDGYDAHYVTMLDPDDTPYHQLVGGRDRDNPILAADVRQCRLRGNATSAQPELTDLIARLDPDVAIGFGFMATQLLKDAAPARPTVLITGTCRQAQDYVTSGRAADALSLSEGLHAGAITPRVINPAEQRAVATCDLVVMHSPLVLEMFRRFFSGALGKLYPNVISFAEWICEGARRWLPHARRFADRDIDALFVATDWSRPEKNYALLRAIARRLPTLRLHVVGDVPAALPGVVHHGFLASRAALFDLLGRARCLACPSLIDAAPGVLFEGSTMGCNVIASKNCGNWALCHPELLADPFGPDAFTACIRRAVQRPYEDRVETLRLSRSYGELMAVLTALSRPFAAGSAR
jgi:glycosyltransferase involved in cell wall biosynthesis